MGLSYWAYMWIGPDVDTSKIPKEIHKLTLEWALVSQNESGMFFKLTNGWGSQIPNDVKRENKWFSWATQEDMLGQFQCISVTDSPYGDESYPHWTSKDENGAFIIKEGTLRWPSYAHAREEVEAML